MSYTFDKIIDEAVKNPAKLYKTPAEVLADTRLTQEEKDKILHSWEQDQIALLRAEEENMRPKANTPSPAEVLKKVKDAEQVVEAPTVEKADA